MDKFDYISSNYLNRVSLCLTALNNVSNKELLALEVFSAPLYELIYAATVTGVEEYLQHRLINEVFASIENTRKYVKVYNHKKKLKNNYQLNEEDKESIYNSLYNKQVYHQLDIVCEYFTHISDFDVSLCPSWESIKPIIKKRHLIIHHGGRDASQKTMKIKPYDVTQAYELARKFINEVEAAFVKTGKKPLIVNPDE